MSSIEDKLVKKQENDEQDNLVVSKISKWIIGILCVLLLIIGLLGYRYVQISSQPYNIKDNKQVVVKIPIGANNTQIANILGEKKIIKSPFIFKYYTKTHNFTDFQAGYYSFKPSMNFDQIVSQLQKGGSEEIPVDVIGKVVVTEGANIDQIGTNIQKNTKFTKKEFLALMKDEKYVKSLADEFPQLLSSSMESKDVRYHLEGYLYPATYDISKDTSLKDLVYKMVVKADTMYKPYFNKIKASNMTVQQTLTVASLVEGESVTQDDRRKIAGVFLNRLAINMPLQSDVAVMYAMNQHKEQLSIKDTKIDSPYNLYVHSGFGPGPFDSPTVSSVSAVLNPLDRNQGYLYFVANLKTKKVYYSRTFDEHNNKDQNIEDLK